jgi:hypothetical protein
MKNKPYSSQILQFIIQSGDSKAFVATFVATERMWLETTDRGDGVKQDEVYEVSEGTKILN